MEFLRKSWKVYAAALILFVLVADGKKKPKKGESNDAAS